MIQTAIYYNTQYYQCRLTYRDGNSSNFTIEAYDDRYIIQYGSNCEGYTNSCENGACEDLNISISFNSSANYTVLFA